MISFMGYLKNNYKDVHILFQSKLNIYVLLGKVVGISGSIFYDVNYIIMYNNFVYVRRDL